MRLGFVIFDGMTALDFIGVYDPLTRLRSMGFMPEMGWDICAYAAPVADDRGLGFYPTKIAKSLADYDVLIVPGGLATRQLVADRCFLPVKSFGVCTGSLLLGAAGFLKGKQATTHPSAFAALALYCAKVVAERVVDAGDIIPKALIFDSSQIKASAA